MNAFVWRTEAWQAKLTDARIENIITGPKQSQLAAFIFEPDAEDDLARAISLEHRRLGLKPHEVIEWSADSYGSLKQRIEQEIPKGVRRAIALSRLERWLDPDKPLPEFEKHTAEIWDGLKSPPAPDAYEARLAKDWRWIGCFSSYALTRLIETMSSDHSPFASESVQLPQLAAEFLNGNCAGTHALSANARQKLKALCKP